MTTPRTARFQTFDRTTDPAHCAARLAALRAELDRRGLDGFLVPRADEHQGEYVPPRAERLAWLTGFTGSAGAAIAMRDRAAIFVDGRYTLQVRDQVDTALFTPEHLVENPPSAWMRANLRTGERVGYDPWLHTPDAVAILRDAAASAGAELVACEGNPVDAAWADQPAAPREPFIVHGLAHAGEAPAAKRARIAARVQQAGAAAVVLTLPESIAWLLNVRGGDVRHSPLPLSFAIVHAATGAVDLFVDERKLTPAVREHLGDAVRAHPPGAFGPALEALARELGARGVMVDPATAAAWVFDRLAAGGARVVRAADPCLLPKACKNAVEVAGARAAHARDGAALTRFLAWIAREGPGGRVDEIAAAEMLEALRDETGALRDLSFDTIAGAGAHGAIVHYRPTRATNAPIRAGELFLIDSGAQYPDGTTDMTRTVAIGGAQAATPERRDRFTRVLRGHIALARAVFPEGTTGLQLDVLARAPLWEAGLDYDHGTGHGVGSYLAVHEGPQSISKRYINQPLRPGMICSNEPGYYKAGEYGIRIENLVVVQPASVPAGGERAMLGFETLTVAPIERALIEPGMLTPDERRWLNEYHARVRETVGPRVDAQTQAWLAEATQAV